MNTIHLPRAVMHQQPLLQALRAADEKFPTAANRSRDFCKIDTDPAVR
jgi:hypothetical protein